MCTAAAFFGMRPSEVRTPKMPVGGEKEEASKSEQQNGASVGGKEEGKDGNEPAAGDW